MRRASRPFWLKLSIGAYVIDTEAVLRLGVYTVFAALHCNAMLSSRHT